MGTETASALFGADSVDLSQDFACDFDPGPGKFLPEPGDLLERPDFASDVNPRPGKFSPESGDLYSRTAGLSL